MRKLLFELQDTPENLRTARFRTVISYVDSENEFYDEGTIEGRITLESSGVDGFGYDSVFAPNSYEKTFAEMSKERKNKISHRAIALNKMKKRLKIYFMKGEAIR